MSGDDERSRNSSHLSRTDIGELQVAIQQNAIDLVAAALSLFEGGHHQQAYALAEAAAEELGKFMLVVRVGIEVTFGGGRTDWGGFWDKFYDHGVKAWNAAFLDYLAADRVEDWAAGNVGAIAGDKAGIEQARRQAAIMVELRERAMYVDFDEGRVRRPTEQISSENAEMMVKAVSGLVSRMNELGLIADGDRLKTMAADKVLRRRADALRKQVNRLRYKR